MSSPVITSAGLISIIGVGFAIGLLAVAFFVGLWLLIIYLVIRAIRKYDDPLPSVDPRSGKGKLSEIPKEIQGWNWAAAFIAPYWGIYHHSWMFLLGYIPGVNLFWWIVMGLKGNEWAWRKNKWQSVERFQRMQSRWRPVGILYFIFALLMIPYVIFYISFITTVSRRITPQMMNNQFIYHVTSTTSP